MTTITRTLWAFLFLILLCCSAVKAQAPDRISRSGREFVETFLHWYVALDDRHRDEAIKSKRDHFDPQLAKELIQSIDAQAKCSDLISPDFDLFLNTQEPAERYVVGSISQKGQSYLANIYAVRNGEQVKKPEVIWEFKNANQRWWLVNIHYPDDGDLVSLLKEPIQPCANPR